MYIYTRRNTRDMKYHAQLAIMNFDENPRSHSCFFSDFFYVCKPCARCPIYEGAGETRLYRNSELLSWIDYENRESWFGPHVFPVL